MPRRSVLDFVISVQFEFSGKKVKKWQFLMYKFCKIPSFITLILVFAGLISTAQTKLSASPDTHFETSGVEIDTIAKKRVVIADIEIFGNKKTKIYIVQREIPFKVGDVIPEDQLQSKLTLCKNQLMNTALFVDVIPEVYKREGQNAFIKVSVKERWYLFPLPYFTIVDRNINQWLEEHKGSLRRVNYGIDFIQENFSGRNDKLNITLINGYTQQIGFRYSNPFIDNRLVNGINVGFAFSRNKELNYITDTNKQKFLRIDDGFMVQRINADIAYTYRPAIRARHSFKVSYTDIKVNDTVFSFNPHYFPEGFRRLRYFDFKYHLKFFDVDYIPYPLTGFKGEAHFYKRFGKETNIWEIGLSGNYNFKMFPKGYMQFQGIGIARVPFNQPYYSTRLFGNHNIFMRGLELYVVDGDAGAILRATPKYELFKLNIKNPIKTYSHSHIPFRFYLKAYGDLGYAYTRSPRFSLLNNKLLATYGAGLDVVTIYDFVFRLDYSFNQLGESGLFFHTAVDF